jgi:nucleoside-diphosphate-sugar epimerase
MVSQETVLFIGFGDIAKRLSVQLNNHYKTLGLRRSRAVDPRVELIQADCTNTTDMLAIFSRRNIDVIVITMTPDEITDAGYERAYVKPVKVLLETLNKQAYQPRLILFVSSTSVYGQEGAEWVDENSVTKPKSFSGRRLLEAEHLLTSSIYASSCVRFSGIYGPGRRRLIDQVIAGHGAAKEPVVYSNRIHADDCAGVLAHLIEKQKQATLEKIYLASDSEPSPLHEVKLWLAEQLDLPPEHLQAKPVNRMLRSSKRCNSQKLLDSGYVFQYPTFREGYRAVLNQLQDSTLDE